jgi:hypothetical protein
MVLDWAGDGMNQAAAEQGRTSKPAGGSNTPSSGNGQRRKGIEVEVRGRQPGRVVKFKAGLDGKPRRPVAGNTTTTAHAELRALSGRISIHALEYSLTNSLYGSPPWRIFYRSGRKSDRRFRAATQVTD